MFLYTGTMATQIRAFWLAHPEYWIALGETQAKADRVIYDTFKNFDFTKEDDFGIVVYLDQFMRHFSRITSVSETTIRSCRTYAAEVVSSIQSDQLMNSSEQELVVYLMPWKHIEQWKPLFETIHAWLKGQPITRYVLLNRFFMDSYRKAYTQDTVSANIALYTTRPLTAQKPTQTLLYDPATLCESHPQAYTDLLNHIWQSLPFPVHAAPLIAALEPLSKEPLTISLSGGVDSMLMTALLKRAGADVVAAHVVYGNRSESRDEQAFIQTYCQKLGIPLYVYTVEWLRRDANDRAFYEEMTRALRFNLYKTLERPVLLGHIQEDVVENIWTNFARGTHLDDLAKFRPTTTEDGVEICRPWLRMKKSLIYEIADALAIPHLKNTTPTWSNRGKFRNCFYAATHAQYGSEVDETLLNVASRITKQAELLDRLLFTPIRESWDPVQRRINITRAVENTVDGEGWQRILTELAHKHLHIGKPSYAACQDFAARVRRGLENGQKITLRKDFIAQICKEHGEIWMVVYKGI